MGIPSGCTAGYKGRRRANLIPIGTLFRDRPAQDTDTLVLEDMRTSMARTPVESLRTRMARALVDGLTSSDAERDIKTRVDFAMRGLGEAMRNHRHGTARVRPHDAIDVAEMNAVWRAHLARYVCLRTPRALAGVASSAQPDERDRFLLGVLECFSGDSDDDVYCDVLACIHRGVVAHLGYERPQERYRHRSMGAFRYNALDSVAVCRLFLDTLQWFDAYVGPRLSADLHEAPMQASRTRELQAHVAVSVYNTRANTERLLLRRAHYAALADSAHNDARRRGMEREFAALFARNTYQQGQWQRELRGLETHDPRYAVLALETPVHR